MKRSVYLFILLFLVISICSFGPLAGKAKALTRITLKSPGDSTKVTTATPKFEWSVKKGTGEQVLKFRIKVVDIKDSSVVWDDDTIAGSDSSKVYAGTTLQQLHSYFWTIWVQVKKDTLINWQEDAPSPFTFFHTNSTKFLIRADSSGDLPTIQEAIVWSAAKDTILVDAGTYYENLRIYKNRFH